MNFHIQSIIAGKVLCKEVTGFIRWGAHSFWPNICSSFLCMEQFSYVLENSLPYESIIVENARYSPFKLYLYLRHARSRCHKPDATNMHFESGVTAAKMTFGIARWCTEHRSDSIDNDGHGCSKITLLLQKWQQDKQQCLVDWWLL